MYVYKRTDHQLYTVGFYSPDGEWEPESDHDNIRDAAARVVSLNGGTQIKNPSKDECDQLLKSIDHVSCESYDYYGIPLCNDEAMDKLRSVIREWLFSLS